MYPNEITDTQPFIDQVTLFYPNWDRISFSGNMIFSSGGVGGIKNKMYGNVFCGDESCGGHAFNMNFDSMNNFCCKFMDVDKDPVIVIPGSFFHNLHRWFENERLNPGFKLEIGVTSNGSSISYNNPILGGLSFLLMINNISISNFNFMFSNNTSNAAADMVNLFGTKTVSFVLTIFNPNFKKTDDRCALTVLSDTETVTYEKTTEFTVVDDTSYTSLSLTDADKEIKEKHDIETTSTVFDNVESDEVLKTDTE